MNKNNTTINLIVLLLAIATLAATLFWTPPPDSAPTYSNFINNATNETRIHDTVTWSVQLEDESLAGYYVVHNGLGEFTSTPFVPINYKPATFVANVTLNITQPHGKVICTQFWFNNTEGNVNRTLLNESCITVANTPPSKPIISRPRDEKDYYYLPQLNFRSDDSDNDTITYKIYIHDMLFTTTESNTLNLSVAQGDYKITVVANDSLATSQSTIQFTVELPSPPELITLTNGLWVLIGGMLILGVVTTENIVKKRRDKKHTEKYERL